MKNQSNIYKFSTTDVISYISQNIDVTNEVVKIIKSKIPNVDKKTTNRIVIINDLMSKVGDLINIVGEKFNVDEEKINKITTSINNITHVITLILKDITPKIISLAIFASFAIPSLIISRLYIIALAWFVRATFRSLGLIANFKIAMIKISFSNLVEIVDNLIYISKKLSMLGLVSRIIIPLLFAARMYMHHLGKFMRTLYWAFSARKTVKISILKIYFDTLNVVSDLILSVTGKLIKLGTMTLLTRWILKSATQYIIQLHIFNFLILSLFRKRDIIGMFIMEKYFEVLSDVIVNIISISNQLIKLRFVVLFANRVLKKHIFKYIVNLGILCYMLTHFFKARSVIKLKLIQIQFKILNDVINSITQIARKIIKNAIFLIIANHLIKKVNVFIWRLKKFVNKLKHLFKISVIRLIGIKFKLRILRGIVNQLILLSSSIIILGLISLIAIPAIVVNTIYVIALGAFIKILQIMLRITKIKLKDIFALIMLIVVLGLLIVIAHELKKLNDIGSQIKWKNLFVIMGAILLVAIFSIMIGFAAMTILPIIGLATIGLLSIVIVVGLIVLVALALQYLQSVQLDSEAVKNNVRLVLGCAKDIINLLVEDETEQPEEEKGWLSNALKTIGGAALDIISIILRFGTLAMTLLCVGMIYLIAGILSGLQKIKLDKEKILTSVQIVMDTAKMITNVLFDKNTPNENEPDNDKKGVLQSLIDFVGGSLSALTGLIESIAAVPVLLMTMMSVGMIFVIANMLNKVMEVQLDSEAIRAKINGIIGVAMDISSMINGTYEDPATKPKEEGKGFFAKLGEGAKDMLVGVANGAISVVENLAGAGVLASVLPCILSLNTVVSLLDSVNKLKFDPANTKTKVTSIIDAAKIISNQVRTNGEVQTIDEDKVKSFGKYVDDSVKYFKNINKLDVSKVKSLGEMYDKMGQFMDKLSDAPINEIADALVNKISPALSDINTNLDKKSKSNTSTQIITQIPQPIQNIQQSPIQNIQQSPIQNTQQTPIQNIQQAPIQNTKQFDYTTILENIEDLLEKIKQKMNENTQLSFS